MSDNARSGSISVGGIILEAVYAGFIRGNVINKRAGKSGIWIHARVSWPRPRRSHGLVSLTESFVEQLGQVFRLQVLHVGKTLRGRILLQDVEWLDGALPLLVPKIANSIAALRFLFFLIGPCRRLECLAV
jgi:hypothetical protein